MAGKHYITAMRYTLLPGVILFIFGLAFAPIRDAISDEETANEVLLQAIPFVSIFITIILLFIMLIAFVALRLHKRVTHHTHQAVEWTLVGGIILGMVSMFQAVQIVGYEYGFLLLLFSLLSFILWTHVTPRSAKFDETLKFNQTATITGAVGGIVTVVLIVLILANVAQPQEPYGYRQRQWDTFDEERQAEIRDEAQQNFQTAEIPYFAVLSIVPGQLVFFGLREVILPAPKKEEEEQAKVARVAIGGSS